MKMRLKQNDISPVLDVLYPEQEEVIFPLIFSGVYSMNVGK